MLNLFQHLFGTFETVSFLILVVPMGTESDFEPEELIRITPNNTQALNIDNMNRGYFYATEGLKTSDDTEKSKNYALKTIAGFSIEFIRPVL